jgi:hypothetical protein
MKVFSKYFCTAVILIWFAGYVVSQFGHWALAHELAHVSGVLIGVWGVFLLVGYPTVWIVKRFNGQTALKLTVVGAICTAAYASVPAMAQTGFRYNYYYQPPHMRYATSPYAYSPSYAGPRYGYYSLAPGMSDCYLRANAYADDRFYETMYSDSIRAWMHFGPGSYNTPVGAHTLSNPFVP